MFLNYEGITIAYVKWRSSEDYLGTEMWLKTIWVKTGLLELIWKLEYLELILKIRVPVIKSKFVKENKKRILGNWTARP